MATTIATLAVSLGNPGTANVVYVSTDYGANRLALELTANAPLDLLPGPSEWLPPEQAATAAGSLICVDLGPVAGLSAFQALRFLPRPDGWAVLRPPPENPATVIMLTPLAATRLLPGEILRFGIGQFRMNAPPGELTAVVPVTAWRIGGLAETVSPRLVVSFQDPSAHKDLRGILQVSAPQPFVVLGKAGYPPVHNRITLLLGPGSAPFAAVPGPQTAFTLSFVYADALPGMGALCLTDAAEAIRVLASVGATGWQIARDTGAAAPSWLLTPPAGIPILGPDGLGSVQFQIEDIVSTVIEGPTELRLPRRRCRATPMRPTRWRWRRSRMST